MNALRRLIAALVLLAWTGAGVHVAVEHGGFEFVPHAGTAASHHGPGDDADGDHHGVGDAVLLAKTLTKGAFAPKLSPERGLLLVEMALRLRTVPPRTEPLSLWESPPDSRRSGWLLVVQTARPVRGPSVAV